MTSTESAELYRRSDIQAFANDAVEMQLTRRRPLEDARRLLRLREPMLTHVSVIIAREIGRYRESEATLQGYVARTAEQAAKDFCAIVSATRKAS